MDTLDTTSSLGKDQLWFQDAGGELPQLSGMPLPEIGQAMTSFVGDQQEREELYWVPL